MATKTGSARGGKTKPTAGRKAAAKKPTPVKKQPAAAQAVPAEALKQAIAYFYLLCFCPPASVFDFKRNTAPFRRATAKSAGMGEEAFFKKALPEICRRIVAFHEGSREPDQALVAGLEKAAREADQNPANLIAFQIEMSKIARSKARALLENRLHRKKGCQFCRVPCRYGYFSLVSDPAMNRLKEMLEAETKKPAASQSPLTPLYGFTIQHLSRLAGVERNFIHVEDLVNLSYCLLMLGMAKSRLAVPEEQLRLFQAANQEFIRRARRRGPAARKPPTG
jgi:hypothetical protein